jgi:hypothetical protein
LVKPVADATSVSVEAQLGTGTGSFGLDGGNSAGLATRPAAKVLIQVTVARPNSSDAFNPSLGTDVGQGLMVGASIEFDGSSMLPRGVSGRVGVGVDASSGFGLLDRLSKVGLSFPDGN